MFAIITENDESEWKDDTGILYHYPKRYNRFIPTNTKLIYYKGRITNKEYADKRLSKEPHYFGTASAGKSYNDLQSSKGDMFVSIDNFRPFNKAVAFKQDGIYLEERHIDRTNYWRDNAVRPISETTFNEILDLAQLPVDVSVPNHSNPVTNDLQNKLESNEEGHPSKRYVTVYERDNKNRRQALAIHGCTCFACGFNFGEMYGEYAKGYIQIHHVKPVSELGGSKAINPETDLIPLCANCHAVVHRRKEKTLSLEEIRSMINAT